MYRLIIIATLFVWGCTQKTESNNVSKSNVVITEKNEIIDSIIKNKFKSYPYSYTRYMNKDYVLTENELCVIDEAFVFERLDLKKITHKYGFMSDFKIVKYKEHENYAFSTDNKIIITDKELNVLKEINGSSLNEVYQNYLLTKQNNFDNNKYVSTSLLIYNLSNLSHIELPDSNYVSYYLEKDSVYLLDEYHKLTVIDNSKQCQYRELKSLINEKGVQFILGISNNNNFIILNAIEFNKYKIIICSKSGSILKSIDIDLGGKELDDELFNNSNTSLDAMRELFVYSAAEKCVRVILPLKSKAYKCLQYSTLE